MTDRPTVLFLCTHNSARSQMAEGLLRAMGGDRFEVHSAGTEATSVRPEAIMVMPEIAIDIGGQASKPLERYVHADVAWLVTVCDEAREACPTLPGVRNQLHWSIEDPAAVSGDGRMAAFRAARDELRARIGRFIEDAGRTPAEADRPASA
jgi:arsenate reductase